MTDKERRKKLKKYTLQVLEARRIGYQKRKEAYDPNTVSLPEKNRNQNELPFRERYYQSNRLESFSNELENIEFVALQVPLEPFAKYAPIQGSYFHCLTCGDFIPVRPLIHLQCQCKTLSVTKSHYPDPHSSSTIKVIELIPKSETRNTFIYSGDWNFEKHEKSYMTNPSLSLSEAVFTGDYLQVQRLIQQGIDINQIHKELIGDEYYLSTVLHDASMTGQDKLVKWLLEHGAEVNIQDHFMSTPLHVAADYGHATTVELLLNHGADMMIKDQWNNYPALSAVREGHQEVIKVFLKHGLDLNQTFLAPLGELDLLQMAVLGGNYGRISMMQFLLENGAILNDPGRAGGVTALRVAAVTNRLQMMEFLLAQGADMHIREANGTSTYDIAMLFPAQTFLIKKYENKRKQKIDIQQYEPVTTISHSMEQNAIKRHLAQGHQQVEMLDNGGISFIGFIDKTNQSIWIYRAYSNEDETSDHSDLECVLHLTNIKRIFEGVGYLDAPEVTSLLLDLGNNLYIYIGECIREFTTSEQIKHYFSPVGNSAVVYPFALSDNYCYLINSCDDDMDSALEITDLKKQNWVHPKENQIINYNNKSDDAHDPYQIFYNKDNLDISIIEYISKILVQRQ